MFLKIKRSFIAIPLRLKSLVLICLLAGIILRFYHLDVKLYSNDETFSTTYIYGRTLEKIIDVKVVSVSELQSYQHYNPNESLFEAFQRLIDEPYVFPPLYAFIVQIHARFVSLFISNNAVITRSCSALISLFSLPLMYWLCWELFQSTSIAWVGTAIIAVSPLHLQYSQIVRTYSLMTAAILLASAALLFVKRVPNKINWIIYALSVALGLYSNVLFGFVIIGHALYMIADSRAKITKTVRQYIYSSLLGISLFLPWLYLFLTKPGLLGYSVAQPVNKSLPITVLIQEWLGNMPRIFVDLNNSWVNFTQPFLILQKISAPLVLILIFVSLGFLIINAFKDKHWLIISLIIAGGGLLMIKDAVLGGIFSVRLRYLLAYVIGLELAVLAFINFLFHARSNWQRKVSEITIFSLLTLGLMSCLIIAQSPSWWVFGAPDYPVIAQKIKQLSKPVVLYNDFGDALTMSYLLDDHVYSHLTRRAEFHLKENQDNLYKDYSDIILFKPSQTLVQQLQEKDHFKLEPLFPSKGSYPRQLNIWKILKS